MIKIVRCSPGRNRHLAEWIGIFWLGCVGSFKLLYLFVSGWITANNTP
jgi:hypothetical protein